jgi:hypothetical protein
MQIKLEYDGAYPNLCAGNLVAVIDDVRWVFPPYSLHSLGSVWFDSSWGEHIEEGAWDIVDWPAGFPESLRQAVLEAVNAEIPHGCCGGCV